MHTFDRWGKVAVAGALVFAITACSVPADTALVTGSTQEAYRSSLDPVYAQMTAKEQKAFDWAVSDFDVPTLHSQYPNGSPLEIIRGEVRHVLESYPDRIKALHVQQARDAPLRAELGRIVATNARFTLERNFFGLQPTIRATITNGSGKPVSRLDWKASLFLDDSKEPVATTVLGNDYRNDGGLRPKHAFTSTFKVGFVRGDERWSTLEIRNAAKTRVELVPIIGSVRDFGDRLYLTKDAAAQINSLQAAVKAAEGYSDI